MQDSTILIIFFGAIFALIAARYVLNQEKISYERLRIEDLQQKRQFKLRKLKITGEDDGNDEEDEVNERLPAWLESILEGANLDVDKVTKGDTQELYKVKNMLDKFLTGQSESGDVIR